MVERERKLLKPFRDTRGEVNVTSFKYISLENDENGQPKMLSESLKEIEEEIDNIRKKIELYTRIISSEGTTEEKEGMKATIEILTTFGKVIKNQVHYKPSDVQKVFAHMADLTPSQAEQILQAVKNSVSGKDNSDYHNLPTMKIDWKNPTLKEYFSKLTFESAQFTLDIENELYTLFKKVLKKDEAEMSRISALFEELNSLYQNITTMQYYIPLQEFMHYANMYVNDDRYNYPDKGNHEQRYNEVSKDFTNNLYTIAGIEAFMADGMFEGVITYMRWLGAGEINQQRALSITDLATFLWSIHKKKVTTIEGAVIETWTPVSYARKPLTTPELSEVRYPSYLTVRKVRDSYTDDKGNVTQYRREKINDLDPRVLAGTHKATVDINGEWLPLEKEDSPYWDERYHELKNSKDELGKLKFEFLQTTTRLYLQKQVDMLPVGSRLDLVVPSKGIDKLEQKKVFIKDVKEGWKYLRNIIPFAKGKTLEEEEQNYLEDIGAVTIENRDIYSGAIISDRHAKLRSNRRIPLARTTEDVTSSIAMFIEDVNEYAAKVLVEPVMKSFADVFKHAHDLNPTGNKNRSDVFQKFLETKIYDEIPKGWANNPVVVKVLAVVNRLTTFRLLGDPIGALINFTSGTINQIIEANFSGAEYAMYIKSGWRAKDWQLSYIKDFYSQSRWGLRTQLIGAFNMMPDTMNISNQLSVASRLLSLRSKLMSPRTESERTLAIHLGLSIVMSEPITHNGQSVFFEDLYELDKTTNLIRLKDEYKYMEDDWNPYNGKKVVMLRRRIMQRYTLLQGNFFKPNQSYASTTAVGKSVEVLKRWFASGMVRHFHGETFDVHLGSPRKGYILAMAHIVRSAWKSIKSGDMSYMSQYWTVVTKRPSEQLALRRALAEFLYVTVFGMLAVFVLGYDDDDEDKNKKLREMNYLKQLMLLVTVRVQSELGTFIPVPLWGLGYMEMKRALFDPFGLPRVTIDNIMGLGALSFMHILSAFGVDFDKELFYQKGKPYNYNFGGIGAFKDKGDSKWFALALNTVGYTGYTFEPAEYIKTLTQMQNRIK